MTHPIPSAFTLEPKWRINLKQTAPIVSYKMHPSNHWILSIYSLRIGRRQCVPDSSIFRWLRDLPNDWLIACEKGKVPWVFLDSKLTLIRKARSTTHIQIQHATISPRYTGSICFPFFTISCTFDIFPKSFSSWHSPSVRKLISKNVQLQLSWEKLQREPATRCFN